MHTILVWTGIGFLFLILTNLAFFDVLRRDFKTKKEKTIWGFIALIPFAGCLIYAVFGIARGRVKN